MPDTPIPAANSPFPVDCEAGKTYFWCACGRSANQPFCDGSHKDPGITPVRYTAKKSRKICFCGCNAKGNAPLCDGTHSSL